MARWESWLIRDTVTVEITSSSLVRVATRREVTNISTTAVYKQDGSIPTL